MTLYEHDQLRIERDAVVMARDSEPDSCHWRVDKLPVELTNRDDFQALVSQAIHEQVERSKWAMVEAVLLSAKKDLQACAVSYDGERRDLLLGKALEFDSAIGAADAKKKQHDVELKRIKAEQQAIIQSRSA